MKKLIFRLILLTSLITQAQDVTKVLFVGNSLTYFNSMPQTFESIANSLGNSTEVTVYAPGGTGFVHHLADQNVFNYFQQGDWDYIVLQPGSNESPGYSFPIQETLDRAQVLNDSIYAYNPCVNVLYYEISYGVWGNSAANLTTYNETMDLIRTNVSLLADSTKAFFAPVGEAFRTSWNADLSNMLWGSAGDIHPNAKGSYIAACVFYASIFQSPSVSSSVVNGLPVSEAQSYRELADSVVLNYLPDWRINTYNLILDYTYIQNADTVHFTNLTVNSDSVVWDFGDGIYSNTFQPEHVYTNNGIYQVSLVTFKGECSDTLVKTIEINGLTTNDIEYDAKYKLYPNPVSNVLYIQSSLKSNVLITGKIFNIGGQLQGEFSGHSIDVSHLAEGIYFIHLTSDKSNRGNVLKWTKI